MSPPLADLLGFRVAEREPGRVVLAADVRDELRNRRGVVHGGVLSALLDAALGGAVVAGIGPEEWCATMQLSVLYVAGARSGPLQVEGRMLRRGRRTAFAEGEVTDPEGMVAARAHGTWHVWPRRPRS